MNMKTLCTLVASFGFFLTFAQNMHVKVPNYFSFTQTERRVSSNLLRESSTAARQHPEFGILPYNAQCTNCVELIDRRTIDSRWFIDPANSAHTFSQQSIFPLHYKNSDGVWSTIDGRLKPLKGRTGVYASLNQPVQTRCDLNRKSVTLSEDEFDFEFNRNLSMYFLNDSLFGSAPQPIKFNNYTIGENGLKIQDAWQNVDMEEKFDIGQIETSFVINRPLNIPNHSTYLVIEDRFSLPEGYTFSEGQGTHLEDGSYKGYYEIRDVFGKIIIRYEKPVYYDTRVWGAIGSYRLTTTGNSYTLQLLVPVDWLQQTDLVYPLVIDPIVYGMTKFGNYTTGGLPSANLGFTSMALGSCDYHMNVLTPAGAQIVDAYIDAEYQLTFDAFCGNPPLPAPFCTFSQVSMEVICDSCQTTTGTLNCNPGLPPYTGTCSTDSNLLPGASAIHVNSLNPNFLSCYTNATCGDAIAFTLRNQDSICGDACGYLCAKGNLWQITLEAISVNMAPVITVTGDSLMSSSPSGNQWFFNGDSISGATDVVYVASTPGLYTVVVSGTPACLSSPFYFDTACRARFSIFDGSFIGLDSVYIGYNQSLGYNLSYLWDFGDGTTSTDPYPGHIYAQAGQYLVCLTVSNAHCTDTYCDSSFYVFKTEGGLMSQLQIINPTGIDEVALEKQVRIWPNPVTDMITIDGEIFKENGLITVYDVEGKVLTQQNFAPQLSLKQFSKGVYIVQLKNNRFSFSKRIVKI